MFPYQIEPNLGKATIDNIETTTPQPSNCVFPLHSNGVVAQTTGVHWTTTPDQQILNWDWESLTTSQVANVAGKMNEPSDFWGGYMDGATESEKAVSFSMIFSPSSEKQAQPDDADDASMDGREPFGDAERTSECEDDEKEESIILKRDRPSVEDLERTPIALAALEGCGLLYHPGIRLAICTVCQIGLKPSPTAIKTHYQRQKHLPIPSSAARRELANLVDVEFETYIPRLEKGQCVKPVQGVSVQDGVQCGCCQYVGLTVFNVRRHVKTAHGDVHGVTIEAIPVKCQLLRVHSLDRVPVQVEESKDLNPTAPTTELHRLYNHHTGIVDDNVEAEVSRSEWPYLKVINWKKVAALDAAFPPKALLKFVALPRRSALEATSFAGRLQECVNAFFWSQKQVVLKTDRTIRKMVVAGSFEHLQEAKALEWLEPKSVTAYIKTMSAFTVFICRTLGSQSEEAYAYVFQKYGHAQEAIMSLVREVNKDAQSDAASEALSQAIFGIIRTTYPLTVVTDLDYPTFHFLAILNMYDDGSFPSPHGVTQSIAHLQWGFRVIMLNNLLAADSARRNSELASQVRHTDTLESSIVPDATEDTNFLWGMLSPFRIDRGSDMSHLLSIKGYLRSQVEQTQKLPDCLWEDPPIYQTLTHGTIRLHLGKFGIDLEQLQHSACLLIQSLCFGHNPDEWLPSGHYLRDDQGRKEIGYSFFAQKTTGPCALFVGTQDGKLVLHGPNATKYLREAGELLQKLAVLMHLTAGGPPRAEEAILTTMVNGNNSQRNIYWVRGRICWTLWYNNSTTMNGQFICRFLSRDLSRLLLQYIVMIRPLETVLLIKKGLEAATTKSKNLLFTTGGLAWSGQRYGEALERVSSGALSMELGIRSWRQLQVAISTKHITESKRGNPSAASGGTVVETPQAGHSDYTTEQHYGILMGVNLDVPEERQLAFENASDLWQKLLSLSRPTQEEQTDENVALIRIATPGIALQRCGAPTRTSQVNVKFGRSVDQSTPMDLRRVLGAGAHFKSPTQARACQAILLQSTVQASPREKNVLVVLPTGAGKTITWLLPHVRQDVEKLSIIMVPLNALMDDLAARLRLQFRIPVSVPGGLYPLRLDSVKAGIVLLSYDRGLTSGAMGEIARCKSRIARIVWEEAHLVITAGNYRAVMHDVNKLTDYGIPVTLVTATCPPIMLQPMLKRYGLDMCVEVRDNTTRWNVMYMVHPAETTFTDMPTTIHQFLELKFPASLRPKGSQILIFSRSGGLGQSLADLLDVPYYHAGLTDEERGTLQKRKTSHNGEIEDKTRQDLLNVEAFPKETPSQTHWMKMDSPTDNRNRVPYGEMLCSSAHSTATFRPSSGSQIHGGWSGRTQSSPLDSAFAALAQGRKRKAEELPQASSSRASSSNSQQSLMDTLVQLINSENNKDLKAMCHVCLAFGLLRKCRRELCPQLALLRTTSGLNNLDVGEFHRNNATSFKSLLKREIPFSKNLCTGCWLPATEAGLHLGKGSHREVCRAGTSLVLYTMTYAALIWNLWTNGSMVNAGEIKWVKRMTSLAKRPGGFPSEFAKFIVEIWPNANARDNCMWLLRNRNAIVDMVSIAVIEALHAVLGRVNGDDILDSYAQNGLAVQQTP
ncbi:hypothetical protein QFC21_006405 [Naganishia friedmannii]|uniref:Uncharacterized protein n=1 Tax=Naganishia friedmannii TaxID=89922 RepID=A0ACC2V368_9TREE|nr:hypothetical protein QFC21_006405 [Naganishia friedmannii]